MSIQDSFRHSSRIERIEARLDLIEERLNQFERIVWEKFHLADGLNELHADGLEKVHLETTVLREMMKEVIFWSGREDVSTEQLIQQYHDTLNILEEQKAKYGLAVPVHIETQIADIRERLNELEK